MKKLIRTSWGPGMIIVLVAGLLWLMGWEPCFMSW